jgi:DNA-binding SARP family transcriptional activator
MWIGLLGTLVVRVNGIELRIAAGKQRAVLATLAVAPDNAVSADLIAETVWDETRPRPGQ